MLKRIIEEKEEVIIPVKEQEETVVEPNIVEEPVEEVPAEIINNSCLSTVNDLIHTVLNLIDEINGVNNTLELEYKKENKEEIKEILNTVADDLSIDLGMLNKAASLIDVKKEQLIQLGKEKAEEIIQG